MNLQQNWTYLQLGELGAVGRRLLPHRRLLRQQTLLRLLQLRRVLPAPPPTQPLLKRGPKKLRRDDLVAAYRCAAASLSSYCAPSAAKPSSCDRTRSSDAASIAAILADAALAASCACARTPNTIIIT